MVNLVNYICDHTTERYGIFSTSSLHFTTKTKRPSETKTISRLSTVEEDTKVPNSVSRADFNTNLRQRSRAGKISCATIRKQKDRGDYHSFVRFMEKLAREVLRPVTMSSECRLAGSGFNVSNFGVKLVAMSARVLANQSTFAPLSSNILSSWCPPAAAVSTPTLTISSFASLPKANPLPLRLYLFVPATAHSSHQILCEIRHLSTNST